MDNKYYNQRVAVDGIVFDSKKEAKRYQELKLMERAGYIGNLKTQVKYELIPAQYIDGKCVERPVTYTADFEYDVLKPLPQRTVMAEADAKTIDKHIVEDVKGYRTDVYKIKKKLMLQKYGIQITET